MRILKDYLNERIAPNLTSEIPSGRLVYPHERCLHDEPVIHTKIQATCMALIVSFRQSG
jgi:hypothetical protein